MLTAGLGGDGRRPAAGRDDERGVALVVEVDGDRIARRLAIQGVDESTTQLNDALDKIDAETARRRAVARARSERGRRAA